MTPSRAAALHAYYVVALAGVRYLRDTADLSVPLRHIHPPPGDAEHRMVRQLCDFLDISYEERSAMLALAGHPFAPSWAREMYGEMPDGRRERRRVA